MNDRMQMIFGLLVVAIITVLCVFSVIKSLKLEHKKEEELKKRKEEEEEKIKLVAEEKRKLDIAKETKELEIKNRLVAYELKSVSKWRTELKAIIVELLK